MFVFFFSSRRRHTICYRDWSSDVCSSDLFLVFRFVAGNDWTNEQSGGEPCGRNPERSEERRVGKECRSRWSAYHEKKKTKRTAMRAGRSIGRGRRNRRRVGAATT